MYAISDIYQDARRIVGFSDEATLFQWVSDALSILANKMVTDPQIGVVDLCVSSSGTEYYATLPREVGAVLAVNADGTPLLGRNQLFTFHLNGPGDCQSSLSWSYDDRGLHPVFSDLVYPRRLVATLSNPADTNAVLVAYGFDTNDRPIYQERGGTYQEGWQVPCIYGLPVADLGMPLFKRITRVRKSQTSGNIQLWSIDGDSNTGLLADYEPDETEPWYRRIRINRQVSWIRVAFRRRVPMFQSIHDRIPVFSRMAILLALKAVKCYHENDLASAALFEAHAARLEQEAQTSHETPSIAPVQVSERVGIVSAEDSLEGF